MIEFLFGDLANHMLVSKIEKEILAEKIKSNSAHYF